MTQTFARPTRSLFVETLRLAAFAALLGGVIGLSPLGIGLAQGADTTHIRVAPNGMGQTYPVQMSVNKSLILDLPIDVHEVYVSQPAVGNAILRSKRRAVVQSMSAGDTNIFFLDAQGRTIAVLDISIKPPVSDVASALRDTFSRVLPHANIDVESVVLIDSDGDEINRVVLSGTAGSTDDVNKAISIATQFAGSPENVASVVTVGGAQQVMLKVTVAEVQREAVKQFGINLNGSYAGGAINAGIISSQPLSGASNVVPGSAITAGFEYGGLELSATLRALERHGALRTLAEPMLTTMSGSEAEFLAGGEFPVPTNVDADGTITYTFKEFGIRLKFTPTIKSDGLIGLAVETEVTEPTTEGGFSAGVITTCERASSLGT